MEKNTKRKLAAGTAAAIAVAGGGAAIGATQLASSPKEESQAVINDAARQLGVAPTKLSDALKQALENRVDAAVAAGRLTKAQGDAMKAKIESGQNVPLILPGVGLDRGFGRPDFGFGFGGPGGGPRGGPLGPKLDAAATYLGLTETQLETELDGGKTLAQVATAHGKTADGLIQALYDASKKDFDAAVTAGKLTQSQEDTILAGLKQRITDMVNNAQIHVGHGFGGPLGADIDAAATYLGLTEAQLRTQLESGKTLAQVATAQGKTVDGLVQALYDSSKKELDSAVTAGKLTQSQEDTILSGLKQRLTDQVNGAGPGVGPDLKGGFDGFRGGPPVGVPGFRNFRSFRSNLPTPPTAGSATA